ncbi:MAG TPA: 2,3-dihydro-2,3-dihydroxybenzoate dehydrogenase [Jatrophihabitans sp.]|nr:2,3-dihydro-2,3-dihydroxybenzoate dehydrogenase [Jatrophihabitans sp.]
MAGRTALVTGASGGIGSEVARTLAGLGCQVALVDRDADQLDTLAEKLRTEEFAVTPFAADVTRADEVEDVVATVEAELGELDYLVNGAGVLRMGEARTLSEQDWLQMFAVNVTGVFLMSRAVVNRMVPRRHGALVTIASNSGGTARAGMAGYGATKAASSYYTRTLGLEVARHGIRCNVVSPGSTDTSMLHSMWQDDSGRQATIAGSLDTFKVGIPLGKLAQPSDVADAVAFLLSDRAGHITMHELVVDGGATLGV